MKEVEFRAYGHLSDGIYKMHYKIYEFDNHMIPYVDGEPICDHTLMQYSGLKDRNDVEIYELSEIDGLYRVVYDRCEYVLQRISDGVMVQSLDNPRMRANEREVTREYSPVS